MNNKLRKLTKIEIKRFRAEIKKTRELALKLEKSNGGDHAKTKQ